MDSLLRDLRHALRSLAKSPGTAAVVVVTIALAIGANTLIFSVAATIFLDRLPVTEPDRLVRVYSTHEGDAATAGSFGSHLPSSLPNYEDLRDRSRSFDGLAAYTMTPVGLATEDEAAQVLAAVVTPEYFDVLGVEATLGRTFRSGETEERAHPVAVLSDGLWHRRFAGDPAIVGQTVSVNGRAYEVVGVGPAGFHGLDILNRIDLWVPMAMFPELAPPGLVPYIEHRRGLMFAIIGRLAPGVSLDQAQADVDLVARGLAEEHPRWNQDRGVRLVSAPLAAIDPNQRAMWVRAGWLLGAVVGLLLLIACANVANLLMVRAAGRRREIAVRLSLGAGRRQIARQLLTEAGLLALVGGLGGVLLAAIGHDLLWSLRPPFLADVPAQPSLDLRVLGFSVLLTSVAGLLFGLAPALVGGRIDLTTSLKAGASRQPRTATGIGRRWGLGRLLVTTQLALSLIALVGAGLFLRSLGNALAIDPGFEAERLLTVTVNPVAAGYDADRSRQLYRRSVDELRALPGVRAVSVASAPPLSFDVRSRVAPEGADRPPEEGGVLISTRSVGAGYFETLGIPLRTGRVFGPEDGPDGRRVAVINNTLAEAFWPGEEAIGKRFRFSSEERPVEVVGVVADAKYRTLGEEPQPFIYLALEQSELTAATLHVATEGAPGSLLQAVRARLRQVDPAVPIDDPETISETLGAALWGARTGSLLLSAFAALALALSALGLYGVLAHTVAQRRREIGIRMALGAHRPRVVFLIVGQALTVATAGLVAGLLLSSLGTRAIAGLLYDVPAQDPWTYTATGAILLVTAVLAALLPAQRAAHVDPMVSIREE